MSLSAWREELPGALEQTQIPLRLGVYVAVFSFAYFFAAKIAIAASLPPEGIVILWPGNAIILVALLSVPHRNWWVFFVATVVTEIAADVPAYPLWAATAYGTVNFLEAALAAFLLWKFNRGRTRLASIRDFLQFLAAGPLIAAGFAALLGAAVYKAGAPEINYIHYWRTFWFGDAVGLIVLGTTLLAWKRQGANGSFDRNAILEAGALFSGLLGAIAWAFLTELNVPGVYLIFPFLLWAAFRFGVRGASLAILVTTFSAIGFTLFGFGPFVGFSTVATVVGLQGLIAAVALSTFALAFSYEDTLRSAEHSRQAYSRLERINEDLDRIVAERTADLRRVATRNEFLAREAHHRVKNNLQIVSSLMAIHSRTASSEDVRAKFSEVQRQISAIGATFDVLHTMESADLVDVCRVIRELTKNIAIATGVPSISVKTEGNALVSSDVAIALSLALNEVITNSIKHAGASSDIDVSCRSNGARVILTVSDTGPGFPREFDLDRAAGFGMRMVRALVAKAEGEFHATTSERGAVASISMPLAAQEARTHSS